MPRRSKIQQERDRVRVSEYYLKGWTQTKIADEIGVTQAIISKTLQICREEWKKIAAMNIDEHKAQELARIDALEQEYWAGWEKSKQDAEKRSSKMIGQEVDDGDGDEAISPKRLERTVTIENKSGDTKYLDGVQWCINKRCEILGINAPMKIARTNPEGDKQADNQVIVYLPSNGRERSVIEQERPDDE